MKITEKNLRKLRAIHKLAIEAVRKSKEGEITLPELATYLKGLLAEAHQVHTNPFLDGSFSDIDQTIQDYQRGKEYILNPDSSGSIAHYFEPYDEFEIVK